MSRHDRPDTLGANNEFQALANRVFVTAYQRKLEGRLPDRFTDQPLSALTLVVMGTKRGFLRRSHRDQMLDLTLAHPTEIELPADVYPDSITFERHNRIATRIAHTTLNNAVRIAEYVPAEGTIADFVTFGGRDIDMGSSYPGGHLMDRSSGKELAGGIKFAEKALRYVESDRFFSDDKDAPLTHDFRIRMDPDLPLTGYEPAHFLIEYHEEMVRSAQASQERLDALLAIVSPGMSLVKNEETILAHRLAAVEKAKKALDKKSGRG